jgi:hypothetical protein
MARSLAQQLLTHFKLKAETAATAETVLVQELPVDSVELADQVEEFIHFKSRPLQELQRSEVLEPQEAQTLVSLVDLAEPETINKRIFKKEG